MSSDFKYKEGDVVKVWSLQSFHEGGFIDGREGIVSQDQIGKSVFVAVERNYKGEYKLDTHYEVYAQQLEFVSRPAKQTIITRFKELINEIKYQ